MLPPIEQCKTTEELVEYYKEHYPAEHVGGMVGLIPRKLRKLYKESGSDKKFGNESVETLFKTFKEPYTRENLLELLKLCSPQEIFYVGW